MFGQKLKEKYFKNKIKEFEQVDFVFEKYWPEISRVIEKNVLEGSIKLTETNLPCLKFLFSEIDTFSQNGFCFFLQRKGLVCESLYYKSSTGLLITFEGFYVSWNK